MEQHTPNGLCINQLKKDAKKLKKERSIKLSEAQDIIAKDKTNFKSWKKLIQESFKNNDTISVLSLEKIDKTYNKYTVYKNKPIISLLTKPGYASNHVSKKILESFNRDKKILYVTPYNNPDVSEFINLKFDNNSLLILEENGVKFSNDKNINLENIINFMKSILSNIQKYDVIFLNEYQKISFFEVDYLIEKISKKCSEYNIPLILISTVEKTENFKLIIDNSSVLFLINNYFIQKHNKILLNYIKDINKESEVVREGLLNFKSYNFISKEKFNISFSLNLDI